MISGIVWLAVALLLAFSLLLIRLASRVGARSSNPEWLDDFSIERFAPMERLLDPSDFKFLKAQPGYCPSLGARLLKERRRAFAGYLGMLTRDFNRLLGVAKLMLVFSTEDRPAFAKALWRQQFTFYFAVAALRCRLALYPLGLTGVDAGNLVKALAGFHEQLQGWAVQRAEAA
jgi:hypothetical protein